MNVERCVSTDNHVYVILTTSSARTQVTSVAMTNASANGCCEFPTSGAVLTAMAAGSGVLLPNRARTTVLSGLPSNTVTCGGNFSAGAAGGQGQLTLPGGVRTVSSNGGIQHRNRGTGDDRGRRGTRRVRRRERVALDRRLQRQRRDDGLSVDRQRLHPVGRHRW